MTLLLHCWWCWWFWSCKSICWCPQCLWYFRCRWVWPGWRKCRNNWHHQVCRRGGLEWDTSLSGSVNSPIQLLPKPSIFLLDQVLKDTTLLKSWAPDFWEQKLVADEPKNETLQWKSQTGCTHSVIVLRCAKSRTYNILQHRFSRLWSEEPPTFPYLFHPFPCGAKPGPLAPPRPSTPVADPRRRPTPVERPTVTSPPRGEYVLWNRRNPVFIAMMYPLVN